MLKIAVVIAVLASLSLLKGQRGEFSQWKNATEDAQGYIDALGDDDQAKLPSNYVEEGYKALSDTLITPLYIMKVFNGEKIGVDFLKTADGVLIFR